MLKKYTTKIIHTYLIFVIFVLIIAIPSFFFLNRSAFFEYVENDLLQQEQKFVVETLPKMKKKDIPTWNAFNHAQKICDDKHIEKPTFFSNKNSEHIYLELNTPITIEGTNYTFVASRNIMDANKSILRFTLLLLILIIILLLGLVTIASFFSHKLKKSLDLILEPVVNFEISENNPPKFPKTDIKELADMVKLLEKRMNRNIVIYNAQQEFIENAAHELQTPLAIFQAKIDALIQNISIGDEGSDILISINENISRMKRLNKNLLLLSKMNNDVYSDKQKIILNDLITKQMDFFSEQAIQKQITIELNLDQIIEIEVNIILVEVLIRNLFMNAIRHNEQNGQLIITIRNGVLTFANTGRQSLAEDKLFNRFYKVKTSDNGTGLGLSIIKNVVDINKWKIEYSYTNFMHYFDIKF